MKYDFLGGSSTYRHCEGFRPRNEGTVELIDHYFLITVVTLRLVMIADLADP